METEIFDIDELKNKEFTVMVVEDDDTNLLLFEKVLTGTKAKIILAPNGKVAVELFNKNPDIDIILMDLKMPVLNGFEATKIIKAKSPNTPIIAQTAYAFSDDATEALESGCDDYISKPIDMDKLFVKILKLLK